MASAKIRKIRARKGCASGIHIRFDAPVSDDDVSEYLTVLSKRGEAKPLQERLTLSYAMRHRWTGWMKWAGTFTETRNLGLLEWHLERKKKNDRRRLSTSSTRSIRVTATSRQSGKGKARVKKRDKKVVAKRKRGNKRAKARTI